jgi:hypothetical protein
VSRNDNRINARNRAARKRLLTSNFASMRVTAITLP